MPPVAPSFPRLPARWDVPRWGRIGLALIAGGASVASIHAAESATPSPTPRLEERGFPSIRVFTPRDYGGHNQIWAAVEGPRGLMYFGAHSEVLEFDGLHWRKIPIPGGAFIRALDIDAAGTLWAGGVDELGRIRPDATGRPTYESLRDRLPAGVEHIGDVRTINVMPDGVYFQTDDYLLRWTDAGFTVWPMHESIICLAVPWGDRLIVCRREGWQMPTADGGWEPVPWEPRQIKEPLLSSLVPDGGGGWWGAATRDGLLHYDGTSARIVDNPVAAYIQRSRLSRLARLPDGRLLFASYGRGLLVTDANLHPLNRLDDRSGLPSGTVICVTVTTNNLVWLGTENGIARLDFSPGITRFTPNNGLDRNGADTVMRVGGEPVLATNNGPFVLQPDPDLVGNPVLTPWVTLDDNINLFFPVADGQLVGGLRGLWWVHAGQVEKIRSPSNIRSLHISPRFPDRLFGLHLTGVVIWRRVGASWELDHLVDAPRGEFQSISEDANGDLWIGTNNDGFWRLPYGSITAPADPTARLPDPTPVHYSDADGVPTQRNRAVVQTLAGAPLFMTGDGLFRYDPATHQFHRATEFGDRFGTGEWLSHYATPSRSRGIWFEAKAAIPSAVNITQTIGCARDGEWHPLALPHLGEIGALDTMVSERVDGDEILWVCGRNGLLRVNTARYATAPPPPVGRTVVFELTTASGRVLATGYRAPTAPLTPLLIHPGDNSVRFRFATPGLAGEPDAVHLSRLIGFVDGDEESTPSGERTFTNLPPGRYTFEARGRTEDYRWSTPARFAFVVLAPWWATSTAKAGYVFAGLLGVYLIVRWRTRLLERQRTQLENVVAARTAELAQKARDLERLHALEHDATLAARLAAETARLELLRYQLNPHFLFNSLNSIRALVHSSAQQADEMVTKLAEFCRRTLSLGGNEMVTVAGELEMARNYLEIEQVRWQDGLHLEFDVDPTTLTCELPQNLLLPLLENAIKYGGRTSPDLLSVRLRIQLQGTELVCEIANTGQWIEPAANTFTDATRIGLQNLRQRLQRHYGDTARITHEATPPWVIVTVTLPRCHPSPPSSAPFADGDPET